MKLTKVIFTVLVFAFAMSACATTVSRTTVPPTLEPQDAPTPVVVTATAEPTATPGPTNTPGPTATPAPTPVPTPAPLPDRNNAELPHAFVGKVTIGGVAAPDDTVVTVWLSQYSSPLGTDLTIGGEYSVLANQHGSETFEGMPLFFKVNGRESGETAVWEKGGATILDISLN